MTPRFCEPRLFRYRKGGHTPEGWSGHGEGRRAYIADVADDTVLWRMLCVIEGKPGDWRIRGVGDPDPDNPKRKFMGPFRTRDDAAMAYLNRFGTF